MGSIELPWIKTNPSIVFFTDFDGTITLEDSNDYLTDTLGYGYTKRRERNYDVLERRSTFREVFAEMLNSVDTPLNECIDVLLKKMKLDPHFVEFYEWAGANNVPIIVLSSGLIPIISALLEKLLGHKPGPHLHIVANDAQSRNGKDINDVGGWEVKYLDDSDFGHDKSVDIKPYAQLPDNIRPTLLYAGDGISDLCAASETDLLFARAGKDLVTFCEREGMPFTTFESWSSILATTKDILSGKVNVKNVADNVNSSKLANNNDITVGPNGLKN